MHAVRRVFISCWQKRVVGRCRQIRPFPLQLAFHRHNDWSTRQRKPSEEGKRSQATWNLNVSRRAVLNRHWHWLSIMNNDSASFSSFAFQHGSASTGQTCGLDKGCCGLRKVLHVAPLLFLQATLALCWGPYPVQNCHTCFQALLEFTSSVPFRTTSHLPTGLSNSSV